MTTNNVENYAARETATNKYIVFAVNKLDGPMVLNAMVKHGIDYKTVQGYYQGTLEDVFIVNAAQFDLVYKYLWWAISTQESILHLGPVDRKQDARPAVLEYVKITRPPLFLGYFYAVSQTTALAQDAWTKDGDQFYVAALHRPDHIAILGERTDNDAALEASNASVRRSNAAAVAHHTDRAYDTASTRFPAWGSSRPLTVKGTFTDRGARTPSGHEF